jgi:hypothetical protein
VTSRADALDAALARGLADAAAGRVVPVEEAFARVRAALGVSGEIAAEPADAIERDETFSRPEEEAPKIPRLL